ncbi:TrbC family F-type conjugative pilus assembly protein [Candidatus Odyssella thessalonicensis]|uniref:TrbC family F-type conjugative pilus assembly protein n=1 Tax=Candidatus Odyssella thessalonicensis TaxID=84647 RepID=UPI000225B989|nr:TrbC family F-type conjugative pilus assembly protein [Candidatus Odyssella thessalonicensis]
MKKLLFPLLILSASATPTLDQSVKALIAQAEEDLKKAEMMYRLKKETIELYLENQIEKKVKPEKACFSSLSSSKAERGDPSAGQLLIFVSSSLSAASLKRLAADAAKIGAQLIFRGLINDSFKDTHLYFAELGIQAQIDPLKFEEHQVQMVPTFILTTSQAADRLQGHVSVAEALTQFKDLGELRTLAAQFLKELGDQF